MSEFAIARTAAEYMKSLSVRQFGPVKEGCVELGDLTLLVGPQATGKSLFLQMLKLVMDAGAIKAELKRFNIRWNGVADFFELYFGEGMSTLYQEQETETTVDGTKIDLARYLNKYRLPTEESLFYIPAQRVVTIRDGLTRPFTDYRAGDPFVVRAFSERLHQLVQTEFARVDQLFPQQGKLRREYRQLIERHVFGKFQLATDVERFQRRMVLKEAGERVLPFLVWSAGQREFVPLLLGLYWLIPSGKVSRRGEVEWVVIEEPEMGLHPKAIAVVTLLVLELLRRGYRVCLSTHSPHVLEVVWAIKMFQLHSGTEADLRNLFELPARAGMKELAEVCLNKSYRVYYFQQDGTVQDISALDPAASDAAESGWGGLTEFSANISEVVSRVVSRSVQRTA
jgi:energy-coupling factor transporter ATP-binding protein EcfA2